MNEDTKLKMYNNCTNFVFKIHQFVRSFLKISIYILIHQIYILTH